MPVPDQTPTPRRAVTMGASVAVREVVVREACLLAERGVEISVTRATIGDTTWPIAAITSIRAEPRPRSGFRSLLWMASAAFVTLAGGGASWLQVLPAVGTPFVMVCAVPLAAAGAGALLRERSRLTVVVETRAGGHPALFTADADFARRVCDAIDLALLARGLGTP